MVDEPWLGAPQFGDCLGTHLGQAGAVLLKQGQVGQLRGIFPKVVEFLDFIFLEGADVFRRDHHAGKHTTALGPPWAIPSSRSV
jgi:hypothetical protein